MSLWELLNDQKEDKEATEKVENEVAKEPEMAKKSKATKKTTVKKKEEASKKWIYISFWTIHRGQKSVRYFKLWIS